MRAKTKIFVVITAAALIVAAAVLIILASKKSAYLTLTNAATGAVFETYPVQTGDRFAVEFIHSVNKSPVCDIYEVRGDGDIYVVETVYYAFGAGVQTELNPGETLEYGDDGSMHIKNIDRRIPQLIYVVGTVSDHILTLPGSTDEISLRELCGKNTSVLFEIVTR